LLNVRPDVVLTLPGRGCTAVVEVREGEGEPPYITVLLVGRQVVERRYTFDESAARELAATLLFEHQRRASAA
jgi:hypothetical protein